MFFYWNVHSWNWRDDSQFCESILWDGLKPPTTVAFFKICFWVVVDAHIKYKLSTRGETWFLFQIVWTGLMSVNWHGTGVVLAQAPARPSGMSWQTRHVFCSKNLRTLMTFKTLAPFLLRKTTLQIVKRFNMGRVAERFLDFLLKSIWTETLLFLAMTFWSLFALCFGKHPAVWRNKHHFFCLFDSRGETAAGSPNYSATLLVKVTSCEITPKPPSPIVSGLHEGWLSSSFYVTFNRVYKQSYNLEIT